MIVDVFYRLFHYRAYRAYKTWTRACFYFSNTYITISFSVEGWKKIFYFELEGHKRSLCFVHKNFLRSIFLWRLSLNSLARGAAWKVSVFAVILVNIFPHSDWIWRDTPYLSEFSPNAGNVDQNNSKYGHFLRSVVSWLSYESKQTKTDLLVYSNILTLFIVSICEIF